MAKLSIKELTSCIMSVMILAGDLDRLTKVLTTSYDDFTDESISISGPGFKDWLKGFKVRERKGKTQSETREKETKKYIFFIYINQTIVSDVARLHLDFILCDDSLHM